MSHSLIALSTRSLCRTRIAASTWPRPCLLESSSWGRHDQNTNRTFADGTGGFSMALLKDLRAQSGAPIVECKKALQNSNNDLNAAMDWLREHGAAKAFSKLQGRDASEGLVALKVSDDGKSASLVKVASETDFAGRSSVFVELAINVADAILQTTTPRNDDGALEEAKILAATHGDKTIQELLNESIVSIRENISVPNAFKMQVEGDIVGGTFVGYVHNRLESSNAGTSAALVQVSPAVRDEGVTAATKNNLQDVGKKLAMHIVAARPQYLSPEHVPSEVSEKEKEVLSRQPDVDGKPLEIAEKIIQGKMRKFYEGICLTEQSHMIEEKNPKVAQVLKEAGVSLHRFQYLTIS